MSSDLYWINNTIDEALDVNEKDFNSVDTKIRFVLRKISEDFIRVGYYLRVIKDKELYKPKYSSIGQYIRSLSGISESTGGILMKLNRLYSVEGYSETLQSEYKNFSWSKLAVLSRIEDIGGKLPPKKVKEAEKYTKEELTTHLKKMKKDTGLYSDKGQLLINKVKEITPLPKGEVAPIKNVKPVSEIKKKQKEKSVEPKFDEINKSQYVYVETDLMYRVLSRYKVKSVQELLEKLDKQKDLY